MSRASLLRLSGLVAGVLAAVLSCLPREPGAGPAIAVPVLAAFLAAGLLAADRTVPPPGAGVRTAPLVRRRVRDVVPLAPAAGVLVLAGLLGGLLTVTSVASTPHLRSEVTPPNPGDGRHFGCLSGGVAQVGPWPGWYYAIPVVATVAVAIVVAVLALRGLITRPVTLSAAEAYRRGTASAIVSALGLVVTVPLAGTAYFSHAVLGQPGLCASPDPLVADARPWLLALTIIASTAAAYYAARLVFPTGTAPAVRPAPTVAVR